MNSYFFHSENGAEFGAGKSISEGEMKKKVSKKETKALVKDSAATYNEFKTFEGHLYTGMKIGRSHKWNYDPGVWKETKITPDEWQIDYNVTKRRAGKAPPGSGVPVGTEYHWYIIAHQNVTKLNANDYSTSLRGLKFKLAHKRADKPKWSASERTQRRRAIKILSTLVEELKRQDAKEETKVIPLKVKARKTRKTKMAG
jgi:hypothetical protein